jgi:hypothetical protein
MEGRALSRPINSERRSGPAGEQRRARRGGYRAGAKWIVESGESEESKKAADSESYS